MSLATLGNCGFDDVFTPAKGKTEWGMDSLTRRMVGARSLLEAFLATLAQGQVYPPNATPGTGYFLQSWEPDDNSQVATVTLNYKGLEPGGTPEPIAKSEVSPAAGAISKNYTSENSGLGRLYKTVPLWKYQFIAPTGITVDEVVSTRPVYTTGATMEFTYDAVQTVYRYISVGKPIAPRYYVVDIPRIPVVKKSRISTADGSIYGTNAPVALTTDLTPIVLNRVVGFSSEPVIGSPYYECQDVVRRELGEGDSDSEGSFGGN